MSFNSALVSKPPILATERMQLFPLDENIRDDMLRVLQDHPMRDANFLPRLDTPEKSEAWWQIHQKGRANMELIRWGGYEKFSGECVGLFTLKEIDARNQRGEIGYSLLREKWGEGFGGEGAAAITQFAFGQLGLHTLFAIILPHNLASQRIVRRLGFKQEARFIEAHCYDGRYHDLLQYSLVNPDD